VRRSNLDCTNTVPLRAIQPLASKTAISHNEAMPTLINNRILLINPNTNASTTERLRWVLTPHLPPNVELQIRTARFGATYIACEASHAVAGHACIDAWAHWRAEDGGALAGVLIGCFGDPGLFALREASHCQVTGLAEASFILAAQHGPFAIVTGGERWKPMLQRLADSLGYGPLLRHIETVSPSGAQLQADPEMAIRCLTQACEQAAQHDVKSIIMGGAGLAGYAQSLQDKVQLPLIDSALAGLTVVLKGMAPPPQRQQDGFFATWSGMPSSFQS
jgi:allantoin racemase